MRRNPAIATLLVVLLALAVTAWLATHDRVAREVEVPLRGEPGYNAYYALERALRASGHAASSRGTLLSAATPFEPGDVLVLGPAVTSVGRHDAERLLDAVERGAHLVLELPRAGDEGALLEALEIAVVAHVDCLEWQDTPGGPPASICTSHRFHADPEPYDWLKGDADDGYVFGQRAYGEGSVVIASELDALENGALRAPANRALAWQLLGPVLGHGRVHLVYATDVVPLYVLVARHGWPIVVPLALALLAWLAARAVRFGPVVAGGTTPRRALLDHVRAAGVLAFQRGRAAALHASVRRATLARLGRVDPALAELSGEPLVLALAQRHGRPAAAIRHALEPTEITRPRAFVAAIRTLVELKEGK
ncbi:MAG TPA: DUF4350 domain-containing protein [Candidatus Saccharimonadia bacterium]|nr:DUF4350 domain-containing protein [Candidatus Saccharimonadia bacterium]